MRKLLVIVILFCVFGNVSYAQRPKLGINFTYNIYSNVDFVDGVRSSWREVYIYNNSSYYYDIEDHYWPYDQLNLDISLKFGGNFISLEPFWSLTLLKGWYGVGYDDGLYIAEEPVLYLPQSVDNPIRIDGEEYLYARGSGRVGQRRLGVNLLLGSGQGFSLGTGIWWEKQKIELYKSMAYNTYWYDDAYAQPGYDAYVTYDDEVYVLAPDVEVVEKNRILFPLILQTINGPVSSHMTFIFQKPFQFLMGFGFYF